MTLTPISALRIYDRDKWARVVRIALDGRTVKEAAEQLGVGWRTLMRWRAELGIRGPGPRMGSR